MCPFGHVTARVRQDASVIWTVAGAAVLVLLWHLLVVPLIQEAARAGAEATGVPGWLRRRRFRERQLAKPAAFTAAYLALLCGGVTLGFGVAVQVAPPSGYDGSATPVVLAVGGVLASAAVLMLVRWWRITSYHLP